MSAQYQELSIDASVWYTVDVDLGGRRRFTGAYRTSVVEKRLDEQRCSDDFK